MSMLQPNRDKLAKSALPKTGRPRVRSNEPHPTVKLAVRQRAEHRCEACGIWLQGNNGEVHHRQKRRFGNHTAENLVLLCVGPGSNDCHGRVHRDRDEEARAHGFVVKRFEDPSLIPFRPWAEFPFTGGQQ